MGVEFEAWPKIPRLKNMKMTITEKIDGTNAQILVYPTTLAEQRHGHGEGIIKLVGSRKRVITPETDNFGFAAWVKEHEIQLANLLGPGRHFGEWAGPGIQKNPLGLEYRRLFLFKFWEWPEERDRGGLLDVVPTLYDGNFDLDEMHAVLQDLGMNGSRVDGAAKGNEPEGIVIHTLGSMLKLTFDNLPKGMRDA